MVFVDKTLEGMLKEIKFSRPIKLDPFSPRKRLGPKKSYSLQQKIGMDYDAPWIEELTLCEDVLNELCSFFNSNKLLMPPAIDEPLLANALEWGRGIKEIRYYSAPGGVVLEIVQNKTWDYKTILDKQKRGLHYSSRKKSHGGGCGLSLAKNHEYEISYHDKSTLILYRRELVENNIKKARENK